MRNGPREAQLTLCGPAALSPDKLAATLARLSTTRLDEGEDEHRGEQPLGRSATARNDGSADRAVPWAGFSRSSETGRQREGRN